MTTYKYSGHWKTTGFTIGNTKWHSGRIAIACDVSGFWHCNLKINADKAVTKDVLLTGKKGQRIKDVNTRKRLLINLNDGGSIHVTNMDREQLREIGALLVDIQNGKTCDIGCGQKLTPPRAAMSCGQQSLMSTQMSPVTSVTSPSPVKRTGSTPYRTPISKENRGGDREALLVSSDRDFEDFKENFNRIDANPGPQRNMFGKRLLASSQEKSRDTLAHLTTGGFYGNKMGNGSDLRDRVHGAVGIISGIKRKPGLMPQFSDRKKFCLSSSPSSGYTWQRKTALTTTIEKQTSLHGFSNLGNTCYMNAILQSLFALETFTADLSTLSRRVGKLLPQDQMQGKLYNCLARLLRMKWRPDVTAEQHRTCLTSVKRAISVTAKRFSGQDQHDAHEFLSQVLDQLKEEVIKIDNDLHPNTHQMAAGDSAGTNKDSPALLNPTNENFEFEVRHMIRCLNCRHEVTKEETFHDLSLDMPYRKDSDTTSSLQDALDQFLRKELIDYTCAACQHKKAQVTHKFIKLPRILVLHLKRYCFDAVTASHTKTGRPVSIARYLTLEQHCLESTTPAYPAPEPCSPMLNRPKVGEDNGAGKVAESTPHHRRGFSFHRPYLSSPQAFGREEGVPREDIDMGKKLQVNLANNSKSVSMDDEGTFLLMTTNKQSDAGTINTHNLSSFSLEAMTEDEMVQLAVRQSMHDSHSPGNSRHDDELPRASGHEDAASPSNGVLTSVSDATSPSNGVLTSVSDAASPSTGVLTSVSDRNVTTCRQCGVSRYFVPSIGRYLCDCVTDSGDGKAKMSNGNAARGLSLRTPRKLDFVSIGKQGESCLGATTNEATCLGEGDTDVNSKDELTALRDAERQEADLNHLVEMADLDDDVSVSLLEQCSQPTDWNAQLNSSSRPSMVLDLTGEEEDKENKTPPPRDISAANVNGDSDWLPKTKEREEQDFLLAVENSLRDQELAEQLQLSAITQDSLHECEKKENVPVDVQEECFLVEEPEDVKKREALLRNVDTGELGYSYRLMSVVSHLGSTSSLGHYVSDVYDVNQGRWLSYNDSDVMRTTEDTVQRSRERCGYIFFYLSKEIGEDLKDWFVERNRDARQDIIN